VADSGGKRVMGPSRILILKSIVSSNNISRIKNLITERRRFGKSTLNCWNNLTYRTTNDISSKVSENEYFVPTGRAVFRMLCYRYSVPDGTEAIDWIFV
jgi:hypothetical protein